MDVPLWAWHVVGFLSGSVPFAYLLGLLGGVDVRKAGSGNPGASNLGRLLGKRWGIGCFVLDVLKGAVPVALAGALDERIGLGAGTPAAAAWVGVAAAAVAGHVFTPWLGFRGGKGVATGLGATLGLWPVVTAPAILAFGIWVAVVKASGYVGLASVVAAVALVPLTALSAWVLNVAAAEAFVFLVLVVAVSLLVVWRHRGNLQRIRTGEEARAAWAGGRERSEDASSADPPPEA